MKRRSRPVSKRKSAGAGVADAVIIGVAQAFVQPLLLRPIAAVIPTNRPASIKVPCVSQLGSIQDYLYVVIAYKGFAGRGCLDMLPPFIRNAHEVHGQNIMRIINQKHAYGLRGSVTRYLSRPSSVWLPCDNTKSALEDYWRVVVNYDRYSGRGCWYFLPRDLKDAHNHYVQWLRAAWPNVV